MSIARPPAEELGHELAAELPGRVRTDLTTRTAYVSDASIYRSLPAAVVEPRSAGDVATVLERARSAGVPVTARGGGTSIAGNAIGSGVIVDFSRHLDRIHEIDPESRTAVVEPGVVLDDLQAAAAREGLIFGPDPSTHSRCTVGGMLGNNSCGARSVAWGTTADNVVELRALLPDGRELAARAGTSGDAAVDGELRALRDANLATFRTELSTFSRQVSGYGLHHLLPENGFNVPKALVGSESTCGLITRATVRLVPAPAVRTLVVLGFPDVFTAAAIAPELAGHGALTVEGMGSDLLAALRSRPGNARAGAELPPGEAWLYCEVGAESAASARDAAQHLVSMARDRQSDVAVAVVEDPARTRALWRIREAGAGIATRLADGGEAWPGWEDSAVPAHRLADYLRDLYALLADHGLRGVAYGHYGEGCVHLRTDFNFDTPRGVAAYRAFIDAAAGLVAAHGGSISGEHGDGRARSALLSTMYSDDALGAFREFKRIFDPEGTLNPGVLVDPAAPDADIRPGHAALPGRTVHAFHGDGGSFDRAVRRCVGVGACRNLDVGSMCPSFKVTRDEVHSTRGRARVLGEMLRGDSVAAGWRSTEVLEALDLCLSCKACAKECPVNVDMATYKAEFLQHHYARRLRPRAHYTLGWLPVWSWLIATVPGMSRLAGPALARRRISALVKRLGGLEPNRAMIRFAQHSLRQTMRGRTPGSGPTVVLWPDTFTNYHDPHIGRAAVEVLEAMGYRVVLPARSVCCGLTWHSTGQLGIAQRVLRRSLQVLQPVLDAGYPIVGLEPSCTVMLRQEARELLGDDARAEQLASRITTLAELVSEHDGAWPFGTLDRSAVSQVHCHQEAIGSYQPDLGVLDRLGVDVDVVGAGCCGLAGNFGYEPGHWEVSQACAERELYPKVRAAAAGQFVLADGFSCRTQIAQGTDRRGLHLAEVLHQALRRA